jgi:hypothetical protein
MIRSELLGFWTTSSVLNSKYIENTAFRKLGLFPTSGEESETPTLSSPLERANLNPVFSQNTSDSTEYDTFVATDFSVQYMYITLIGMCKNAMKLSGKPSLATAHRLSLT